MLVGFTGHSIMHVTIVHHLPLVVEVSPPEQSSSKRLSNKLSLTGIILNVLTMTI